jgi:hypothetical protein
MDPGLLQTAAAAWQARALDATPLGSQSGMGGVLHPWTRARASQPPVQARVPAGALSPDGAPWLSPRSEAWRGPVRALSHLFRGTGKEKIAHANLLDHAPAPVWPQAWGPHGDPGGTGPEVLPSLASSLRRLALTNNRMAQREDGSVPCRGTARGSNAWQHRTFPAHAGLRRVLQHGLPQGCSTVSDSGCLRPDLSPRPHAPHASAGPCRLAPPGPARRENPAPSRDAPGTTVPHRSGTARPHPSSLAPHKGPTMIPCHRVAPGAERARQGLLAPPGTAFQEHGGLRLTPLGLADAMRHPQTAHPRLPSRQVAHLRSLWSPMRPASQTLPGSSAPPPTS